MLESLREVREVDVAVQEQEVAKAFAALEHTRAELAAAEVRSPSAGRILKIHTRSGERIRDEGLLELGDVQHMQAVAEVFEGDVQFLRPGLTAYIDLKSTQQTYQGQVAEVGFLVARKDVLSNDPVSDTDARVIEVRIDFRAADIPQLERLSNARVEVTIEIPKAAVAPSKNLARNPQPLPRVTAAIVMPTGRSR